MLPARCLFPNRGDRIDGQPEAPSGRYDVSNNNRWSRITLNFSDITPDLWCELSFHLESHPREENCAAHDFALVGLDFQMEDGSSIDYAYVPGLTRTQIGLHGLYVAGSDSRAQDESLRRIAFGFFMPSPARQVSVHIRSWRNSQPFTITNPKLLQSEAIPEPAEAVSGINTTGLLNARYTWRALHVEPTWFRLALVPGCNLLVRGQITNESLASEVALARIVYRDAKGEELTPPYPELAVATTIGAFVDIPVHRQARRFTLDLAPPPGAASVEIGFQAWHTSATMELVTPLEVSLDDDLSLEAVSGEGQPDASAFLKRFLDKLTGAPGSGQGMSDDAILARIVDPEALATPFTFHDKLAALQHGGNSPLSASGLALAGLTSWPLPDHPQWTEDPYQSLAWRMEFQSLTWLRPLLESDDPKSLMRAAELAMSWSHANPWGSPSDSINLHPRTLAARAETLLLLLSATVKANPPGASRHMPDLLGETVRHAFALAQILGQNIFAHSIVHIHAACTLLALARALPHIPVSPYWESLAELHLREGFGRFIDPNGTFAEQSSHVQLELVSLGLILVHHFGSKLKTHEFFNNLGERLRKGLQTLVAVTDPSGSLPPFGDAPYGFHHASWLRRLLSAYGTRLLSDHHLATELSYPTGKKVFSSALARLVAARYYERNPRWGYFCASLDGRHHEHGHHDCTSFVYSTGGTSWIVDPRGSSRHEAGAARQYLVSSAAHNVALPNGREQLAGIGWIEAHAEVEGATIVKLGSNVFGPSYDHRRIFVILENLDGIAVFDRFSAPSIAVSFEGLLHFDTDIVAAIASTRMGVAYRKNEKLRVVPHPVEGAFSGMAIENGRSDPPGAIQGFVARPTGGLQPANVFRYRFSGQKTVCGGVLLAVNDRAAIALSNLLETDVIRGLLRRQSDGSDSVDRSNPRLKPWAPDHIGHP